ncbi:PREDICTED: uncharacterized protein LOC109329191 [Lupinus angustifolius]|uniref:uncharacterized protein LOC109329191 n=1 Tax=Lupinus angustifolius TaxID=3871 RepID=UPI00092E38FB|nr:PREDICTED: uncharacterized protein LOC109329191 [Lupinus angustifolius]
MQYKKPITNNCWFSNAGFAKFVEDEWKSLEVSGRGSFVLKEKLKRLKGSLKIWNKEHFGVLDKNIADKVTLINSIDGKGSEGILSVDDIAARRSATADLWRLSRQKDNLLLQKSRQKWLREESHWNRPSLDGIEFNGISAEDNHFLTSRFEEEEIKEAVWSCEGDKSPGPDGFNFTFIKKSWDCVKSDIIAMVDDFYIFGDLARGCNASFIVLIPKSSSPQGLGDFRPISLVGCIHKLISKLLVGRLKRVIHSVISDCQTAFIKGRNIMDGVVIANEIIDQARKKKDGNCFIFKVDFEKAYDSVNWSFLLYMLERMGFCFKWRNWIKSCLQSNSFSILVNGSPTSEFRMARGLRQGDPIAPFLFLIVAEGLGGIMRSAVSKKIFTGYSVGRDEIVISHLQYADDTLLIGENSADNIMVLKSILKCFELVSGLKINFHKSSFIGIKADPSFVQVAVNRLLCGVGSIPFKFLGIPVGANPKRLSTWSLVIDTFKRKLSRWQQKLLSFGGRVTLLKSVLSSLPIYYFSFFKAPVSIIHELERIQRRFLWGRGEVNKGIHWVRWKEVCRSKEEGGLGVKNLGLFNLALLGKWRWHMLSSSESLWVKVLRSIYGVEAVVRGGLVDVECFKKGSSWWRDLGCLCNRDNGFNKGWFNEGVRRRVGSGQSTLFWRDIWVGGECLKNCFERLFQVTLNKDACISSMGEWRNGVWCWLLNWRRSLFLWEQDEVNDLLNKVEEVRLVQGNEDGWLWVHDKNGTYSVRNAYKVLQNEVRNDNYLHYKRLWASKVPSKLKCFAWRLFVGGVPTWMNLARRGIIGSLPSTLCAFCGELEESSDHLFFTCSLSYSVWQKLYSLFGIYSILPSSTGSNFLSHWHLFGEAKKFHQQWMTIWFVTIWSLWLVRNKIIFEESSFNVDEVMFIINLHSWNLLSARFEGFSFSFLEWVWNPSSCISCNSHRLCG